MKNLFGINRDECQEIMVSLGQPAYRGKQLYEWLYQKKAASLDECTNLPKSLRERLKENFDIDHGKIEQEQRDHQDGTSKFLIRFSDGQSVETVLMSYHHGYSICVSSQVGCAMGCRFCASTLSGKVRNLTAGEILDQLYLVEREKNIRISNVVIMGMGEPLDNYDEVLAFIKMANEDWGIGQRKITLSTCGLVPEMKRLAEEDLQINLAISLHSAFQEKREALMPIARRYSMEELLKTCNIYFTKTGRRISFEYALIQDFNDGMEDVKELAKRFRHENCHINLIPLNPVTESAYKGSDNVNFFSSELKKRGINCTIRRKMGSEIDAACGQLRRKTD